MIPILFQGDLDPVALQDVNAVDLQDTNSIDLLATADWTSTRTYTTYGIGALSDCISCEVEEERNGAYELVMEYPAEGVHFSDIKNRSIILAKPNYTDAAQPFRVYRISIPINGVVTINAAHLSYDLSGIPVVPFTASTAATACASLKAYSAVSHPFTISTTLSASAEFKVEEPSSLRSWFGGKEGSLIDVYGGEWHYNGYTCTLESARGADRGVVIRYGKNLIDIVQETNIQNTWTGVLPFWRNAELNDLVVAPIQNVSGIWAYRRVMTLDLSYDFESRPTISQLSSRASSYMTANNIGKPKVNIALDWAQMTDRVDLCDTVTVEFEKLGINVTAKCVSTTWDVLKDRYSSVEIGDVKTTIAGTIVGMQETAKETATYISSGLATAITNATNLITGNSGGYVVMHDSNGDGEPDEILVMDTPDISTAVKIWRWNKNGLGYSSSGYSGTFGLAMTANGEIVADYITTGSLSADRISGGTIDATNVTIKNLDASKITAGTMSANYISGGTIDATDVTITNLNASNITSGTLSANRISGGTLKLGGSGNGYGSLSVLNASNVERIKVNNVGIYSYDTLTNYYTLISGTRIDIFNTSNTNACSLSVNTSDQSFLQSAGTLTLLSSNGNVGISVGTNGYLTLTNVYNKTNSGAANLFLSSGGYVYRSTSSSRRYKTDITDDLGELEPTALYDIGVVKFKYRDDYLSEDDQRYGKDVLGFIAEDVAELMPGAVDYDDEGRPEMWNVHVIVPAMLKLIQNQKNEIDELKARLDRLEARFLDDGR